MPEQASGKPKAEGLADPVSLADSDAGAAVTVLGEDGETMLWQCNDCGVLVPAYDDMCSACYEEQCNAEFWEMCHPEARCPRRE